MRLSIQRAEPASGQAVALFGVPALELGFFAALLLILLPFGAANRLPFALAATVASGLVAIAIVRNGEPAKVTLPFRLALVLLIGLGLWGLAQTLPLGGLANPAWTDVAAAGTISVTPIDGRFALLVLALPFVIFLGGLSTFADDAAAERLLRFIGLSGGVIALWSLVQFLLLPDTLLLSEKLFYLDSLTGVFINRNTAGTYFGLVALVLFALAHARVELTDWAGVAARLLSGGRRRSPVDRLFAAYAVGLLAALTALFLTKSRAGVGSTFFAFLVLVPLLLSQRGTRRSHGAAAFGHRQSGRTHRLLKAGGGLLVVFIVGLIFADRALFRAEVQGVDDGRFCVAPAIARAAADNWLTGVGFGSFRQFFPAYRDASCGLTGIWDRAHSVYLEGFLGFGLLFWVALVVGVGALLFVFVHGIHARRSKRGVPAAGLAVLLLTLAHSLVDFSLQIPGFAAIFAATMAAAVTVSLGRDGRHAPATREKANSVQFE